MTFGQKLKRYREENMLTQEELAALLSTQKQNICRFEKNHYTPKADTVRKYAETLQLPFSYLYDDNIVTESGLNLSNASVRRSLWRYIDIDEFGTPVLIFNGLCNSDNLKEATENEEMENKKYKILLEELRKNPLGREEVKIITELRKQPDMRIAVKRILKIES